MNKDLKIFAKPVALRIIFEIGNLRKYKSIKLLSKHSNSNYWYCYKLVLRLEKLGVLKVIRKEGVRSNEVFLTDKGFKIYSSILNLILDVQ